MHVSIRGKYLSQQWGGFAASLRILEEHLWGILAWPPSSTRRICESSGVNSEDMKPHHLLY